MVKIADVARPKTGVTPVRNLRVGAVWDHALRIARRRGETITGVIIEALEAYIKKHGTPEDNPPE